MDGDIVSRCLPSKDAHFACLRFPRTNCYFPLRDVSGRFSAPVPMVMAVASPGLVWELGLRLAAAESLRACEEFPARQPVASRCHLPSGADRPRVGLRAGRYFGVSMRDRAQAVANRVKRPL